MGAWYDAGHDGNGVPEWFGRLPAAQGAGAPSIVSGEDRRHRQHMRRSRMLMSGLVLASTVSSTAGAFKEHWHKAITQSALSFLQQPILASMLKVHDQLDAPLHFWTAGVDHWHFNDCNFEGSTKHINELYGDALGSLADPTATINWKAFGQLLHTAQDFYAHTNWIDLGQKTLVDSKLEEWTVISPYSTLASDILAIEGRKDGFRLNRTPGERVVLVEVPGRATTMRGLISGAAYARMHCPREVELG